MSKIKRVLYLMMPPIVPKLIKRLLVYRFRPKRVFSSFDEALKWCIPGGYLNQNLIDVISIRSSEAMRKAVEENMVTTDFPHLTVFFSVFYAVLKKNPSRKKINIIDFGGGFGDYYFYIRHLLGHEFQINYNIVETDAMCKKARSTLTDSSLNFWINIEDAIASVDRIDIIISSGAIQYVPDPYSIINSIIDSAPEYILFSRCSLTTGNKDMITIQEYRLSFGGRYPLPAGYKDMVVSYPHTNIQKKTFENMLSEKYRLFLKILDDTGIVSCEGEEVVGGAYFYEKK